MHRTWEIGTAVVTLLAVAVTVWVLSAPKPSHGDPHPAESSAETSAETRLEERLELLADADDPTPEVPESDFAQGAPTPAALLAATFSARARGDLAWLARAMKSKLGKARLTEIDLHDARREFMQPNAAAWTKVEAAWSGNAFSLFEDDDIAVYVFRVGGNLGEMRLELERVNGQWYFAAI